MDAHQTKPITEEELRLTGFTAAAAAFPLSEAAVRWLARYNGVPAGMAVPRGWHYAPNEYMRRWIEKLAEIDCPVLAKTGEKAPLPAELGLPTT